MYSQFRVQNFRGFKDLELKDLARVNLIAGKNNVGKTALLEALFIYTNPYRPDLAIGVFAFRGIQQFRFESGIWADYPLNSLFLDYQDTNPILLDGVSLNQGNWQLTIRTVTEADELSKIGGIKQGSLTSEDGIFTSIDSNQVICFDALINGVQNIHYLIINQREIIPPPPTPKFQGVFLAARVKTPFEQDAERFTKIKNLGKYRLLLKSLQVVEPRLANVELLKFGGETILHGDIGNNRSIPLPLMGDGISRLASLVLAMVDAPNGILLVDEIENGLHYAVLANIWTAISHAANEMNVQIFATTHSREMIQAAHEAFKEMPENSFRYHRLDRDKTGDIYATSYDEYSMAAAMETEAEVR